MKQFEGNLSEFCNEIKTHEDRRAFFRNLILYFMAYHGKEMTPEEWCDEFSVVIIDPDGWRRDKKPMTDKLDLMDFLDRWTGSTAGFRNSPVGIS